MWAAGSRLVVAVGLCSLTSGCCTSMRRAAEIDDELQQQNLARAEPAMRSAAQRQGAMLLPDQPQALGFTPLCDATQDPALRPKGACVLISEGGFSATGRLGDVYQLLGPDGKRRIAIAIGEQASWVRLAKRGDTLLLLSPRVTFHPLDHRALCECNVGPSIVSMSSYVNLGSAFVVEDLPRAEIQSVIVPVDGDYIERQCKYARNEHVPRPAVAYADARPQAVIRSSLCAP